MGGYLDIDSESHRDMDIEIRSYDDSIAQPKSVFTVTIPRGMTATSVEIEGKGIGRDDTRSERRGGHRVEL